MLFKFYCNGGYQSDWEAQKGGKRIGVGKIITDLVTDTTTNESTIYTASNTAGAIFLLLFRAMTVLLDVVVACFDEAISFGGYIYTVSSIVLKRFTFEYIFCALIWLN